jgi:hypothetical protein
MVGFDSVSTQPGSDRASWNSEVANISVEFGIRAEIERMRQQISRQRKDIRSLQHAGISTLPAEALLARMQATVDNLCAERDRLVGQLRVKYPGTNKVIKGPQMRLR